MKKRLGAILFLILAFLIVGCSAKENNTQVTTDKNTEDKITTYEIETPYVNLEYPEKWKDQLRTQEVSNGIEFYGKVADKEEVLLFTIEFEKSEGYLLGTLDDTNVYILDNVPQFDESWTEEEKEQIYTMQEDVNVILQGLLKMENFVLKK